MLGPIRATTDTRPPLNHTGAGGVFFPPMETPTEGTRREAIAYWLFMCSCNPTNDCS